MADNLTVANGVVNGTLATKETGGVHTPIQNAKPYDANGVNPLVAHDSAIAGAPTRIGARARTSNYSAVSADDVADLVATVVGALITRPYSTPEQDWAYAGVTGGITNTSDVVLAAAAGAGLRNYCTAIQLFNSSATATEVVIKDGTTVIWRGRVGASMTNPVPITFPTPLKSSANAALNFACITTATATIVSAQGYVAP